MVDILAEYLSPLCRHVGRVPVIGMGSQLSPKGKLNTLLLRRERGMTQDRIPPELWESRAVDILKAQETGP